jgi:hypothetical protein
VKNKLLHYSVMLLGLLIAAVACQFFSGGTIEPLTPFGVVIFLAAAFFSFGDLTKEQFALGLGRFLGAISLPVVFVVLVYFILSLLSIHLTLQHLLAIYLAGVAIILPLLIKSSMKDALRDQVDEGTERYITWSGHWSFLFLNFLIICALVQPWVPLDQNALWVGVLIAGLVFWLTFMFILEKSNRNRV